MAGARASSSILVLEWRLWTQLLPTAQIQLLLRSRYHSIVAPLTKVIQLRVVDFYWLWLSVVDFMWIKSEKLMRLGCRCPISCPQYPVSHTAFSHSYLASRVGLATNITSKLLIPLAPAVLRTFAIGHMIPHFPNLFFFEFLYPIPQKLGRTRIR